LELNRNIALIVAEFEIIQNIGMGYINVRISSAIMHEVQKDKVGKFLNSMSDFNKMYWHLNSSSIFRRLPQRHNYT
jgi:hypothetical protein